MTLAIMAIAFGLSRALFPLLFLRRATGVEHLHWFPLIFHLVHHVSAIVGAVIYPASLKLKQCPPAFLSNLAKTVCLFSMAIFYWFLDNGVPSSMLFLLLVPLFVVGICDGLQQRLLLTQVIDTQRDEAVAQQRYHLFTLLLLTSLGPFFTSLLVETNTNNTLTNIKNLRCFGICPLSIHFGIPLTAIFLMLAFLQALLILPSLWASKNAEKTEENGDHEDYGDAIQYLPTLANCPPTWRLLFPLCALCAFSAALFNNFGTILFTSVPMAASNLDEMPLERLNFIAFSASALFTRIALALSHCSAISQSKIATFIHSNALFTAGLFGSGLAFCALNVPSLRTVAVTLFGASLALFWPTVLAQWCNFHDSMTGRKNEQFSTLVGLLISVEFGSLLFPLLFTQLLTVYCSPRLFNTVALFLIIAMVVTFVCLLNVQAEYKKGKRGEFWGFWRGGRTRRSIRRLMRSVRTSIRRKTSAGRQRHRLRPRMDTETALLDGRSSASGAMSRLSNYQSVVLQQGFNEHGAKPRSRINTAHDIILITCDQKNEKSARAKRHISLPDIVIDIATPQMDEKSTAEADERQKFIKNSK
ncbi:hypothetical protein niasHT_037294 [Heterodera trifolii]|uniref:Uncharacterized protein n=1 Tax=Heterodera trifolii TaxID=157864 RepID=A0ABD2J6B2_9BILA